MQIGLGAVSLPSETRDLRSEPVVFTWKLKSARWSPVFAASCAYVTARPEIDDESHIKGAEEILADL